MIDTRLFEMKQRMQFYRDCYRRGVVQLISLLCLIVILIISIFYEVMNQPPRAFYASTATGELIKLAALDAPNSSSTPLIQ